MFNRFTRLWKLSKYPEQEIAELSKKAELELGDGKAVFIGEGTEEDFEEQQKEDDGTKAWYNIFGL